MERFTPFRWSEEAKKEKRMHKLRYEPRAYEYLKLPGLKKAMEAPAEMTVWEAPAEREIPSLGLIVMALLKSLNFLPDGEDSGIEAVGK